MANKFLFCVLLITLTVNLFWSSNTQVMALRDLSLSEKVIEQVVQLRGGKRCFSTCYSHAECAKPCTLCRQARPHYDPERKCFKPK